MSHPHTKPNPSHPWPLWLTLGCATLATTFFPGCRIRNRASSGSPAQEANAAPRDSKTPSPTDPTFDPSSSGDRGFDLNFWPLVRAHCSQCHDSIQNPQFANADKKTALNVAKTWKSQMDGYKDLPLVNLDSPDASRIVLRLSKDKHNCWGDCAANAQTLSDAIGNWKKGVQGNTDGFGTLNCTPNAQLGPRRLRLLSNREYENTVKTLFPDLKDLVISLPNDISKKMLFDNISAERPVQQSHLTEYLSTAMTIADTLDMAKIEPCSAPDTDLAASRTCASSFLQKNALRIWRRPLSADETAGLLKLYDASASEIPAQPSHKEGMKAIVAALLVSPSFLYRTELGSDAGGGIYGLNAYEIASALSYFFWRSNPDDALLNLAGSGKLTGDAIVAEARRMVADPKARETVKDFGRYWLRSYQVMSAPKNPDKFPDFTNENRKLFLDEASDFFVNTTFDSPEKSYSKLLTADYTIGGLFQSTWYNGTIQGERHVLYPPERAAGLLGQASLLSAYSYHSETSPIHRGVFVIENLLCRPFGQPLAVNVPDKAPGQTSTDRFKAHTANPVCASCHAAIDGVGYSFENFNAVGKYIAADEKGSPISSDGKITLDLESRTFKGVPELARLIAGSEDGKRCFVTQWTRYAYGRKELTDDDKCHIVDLTQKFKANKENIPELMVSLFQTQYFLRRRSQP